LANLITFSASLLLTNLEFGKKRMFLENSSAFGQSNLYKLHFRQVHFGAIFIQDQLFQSKTQFFFIYLKKSIAISSFLKTIA
jgi:hypothetical protein